MVDVGAIVSQAPNPGVVTGQRQVAELPNQHTRDRIFSKFLQFETVRSNKDMQGNVTITTGADEEIKELPVMSRRSLTLFGALNREDVVKTLLAAKAEAPPLQAEQNTEVLEEENLPPPVEAEEKVILSGTNEKTEEKTLEPDASLVAVVLQSLQNIAPVIIPEKTDRDTSLDPKIGKEVSSVEFFADVSIQDEWKGLLAQVMSPEESDLFLYVFEQIGRAWPQDEQNQNLWAEFVQTVETIVSESSRTELPVLDEPRKATAEAIETESVPVQEGKMETTAAETVDSSVYAEQTAGIPVKVNQTTDVSAEVKQAADVPVNVNQTAEASSDVKQTSDAQVDTKQAVDTQMNVAKNEIGAPVDTSAEKHTDSRPSGYQSGVGLLFEKITVTLDKPEFYGLPQMIKNIAERFISQRILSVQSSGNEENMSSLEVQAEILDEAPTVSAAVKTEDSLKETAKTVDVTDTETDTAGVETAVKPEQKTARESWSSGSDGTTDKREGGQQKQNLAGAKTKDSSSGADESIFNVRAEPFVTTRVNTERVETQNTPVTPKAVIDQIVQAASLQKSDGVSKLELQLNPEFLGKISIVLSSGEQGVTAQIKAGNDAVRSLLNNHIAQLQDSLRDMGINMKSIEITNTDVSWTQAGSDRQNRQNGRGTGEDLRFEKLGRALRMGRTPVGINPLQSTLYGTSALQSAELDDVSVDFKA